MKAKRIQDFTRGGDPYEKLKAGRHHDVRDLPIGTVLNCVQDGVISILQGSDSYSADFVEGDKFTITKDWNDHWYGGDVEIQGTWDKPDQGVIFGVNKDYIGGTSDFFAIFEVE